VVHWISPQEPCKSARDKLDWCKLYLDDPVDDIWYANLFPDRHRKKYCADYCNLNSLLDHTGWNHVRTVAAHVRAIYTIRNPAERLWSHAKFHARFLGIHDCLCDWSVDRFRTFLTQPGMTAAAAYSGSISRMRDVLDPTEYRICYFEDFHSDPVSELRSLEAFLEVPAKSYGPGTVKEVHNPTPPVPAPASFFTASERMIAQELAALDRLGIAIPAHWTSGARSLQDA